MRESHHILTACLYVSAAIFTAIAAPLPGRAAPAVTLVDSFNSLNGKNPQYSALTPAGGGIYYGTVSGGGDPLGFGSGGVYEFNSATGAITLKASFNGLNGASPWGSLTAGSGGLYYGTFVSGGDFGFGGIYEFDSNAGTISLKYSCDSQDCNAPYAGLTPAGGTLFYGTSSLGGSAQYGNVFQFDSATGAVTSLAEFNGSNGDGPKTSLTPAGGSIYYGTTQFGGANGFGTVFKFDSSSGTIDLMGSCDGTICDEPLAALTDAGGGIFYGSSRYGGDNAYGAIFKFDSINGNITLAASCDANGTDCDSPQAGLTPVGGGIYYGTSASGGTTLVGSIFAFDSNTGSISLLASFDGTNGAQPRSSLTAGAGGVYYATTTFGGANGDGAIYSFNPSGGNPVPGPLPLLGAGAAFGWSRRLRRRVRQAAQVRPLLPVQVVATRRFSS